MSHGIVIGIVICLQFFENIKFRKIVGLRQKNDQLSLKPNMSLSIWTRKINGANPGFFSKDHFVLPYLVKNAILAQNSYYYSNFELLNDHLEV